MEQKSSFSNSGFKDLDSTNQELSKCNIELERTFKKLKAAHEELKESYIATIYRLALAAEYKDGTTGAHLMRISRYSAFLAEKLGLPEKAVENIYYASPMHDIGKIGIPDNILLKPVKLTKEEFEAIKRHTFIGAKILSNSRSKILNVAERIALFHHEQWNGKGYPRGISGEKIPLFARIVSLVDFFDALASPRPYKDAYPIEEICELIKKERAERFDPAMMDVFLKNIDGILKIKKELDLEERRSL